MNNWSELIKDLGQGYCLKVTVSWSLSQGHCLMVTVSMSLSQGHCLKVSVLEVTVTRSRSDNRNQWRNYQECTERNNCKKYARNTQMKTKILSSVCIFLVCLFINLSVCQLCYNNAIWYNRKGSYYHINDQFACFWKRLLWY